MARTRKHIVTNWDDVFFKPRPAKPRRRVKPAEIPHIDLAAYFSSPHWQSLRARLISERQCCEICRSATRLSLHHRRYTRMNQSIFWREQDNDLVLLCWKCHQAWERHCKGHPCTPEQLQRIWQLMSLGLKRDGAFPAAVATNAEDLLEVYKRGNRERSLRNPVLG